MTGSVEILDNTPSTIGGARVAVPFCRVEGVARPSSDSEIRFEVWLPSTSDKWTGRMKVDGTGGYAGGVPYALLAQDIGETIMAALDMPRRALWPELEVFATNPWNED